jgi:hypothetical protein
MEPEHIWTVQTDGRPAVALVEEIERQGKEVRPWAKNVATAIAKTRNRAYRLGVIYAESFVARCTNDDVRMRIESLGLRLPRREALLYLVERFTGEELLQAVNRQGSLGEPVNSVCATTHVHERLGHLYGIPPDDLLQKVGLSVSRPLVGRRVRRVRALRPRPPGPRLPS